MGTYSPLKVKWGHPPTEHQGGPTEGQGGAAQYMGTKVRHRDIPSTKGQLRGHPPTEHQGGPTGGQGGAAQYMGISTPSKVSHGDIHQLWGQRSGMGTLTPTEG